jgi:hypothetical protein
VYAALLLLALSANEPAIEAPLEIEGWHFAGIPLVSYGSDLGLSIGGALFFYKKLPDHPGEAHFITLSASYATRGPKSLDGSWSQVRIFGTSLRTFWNLHLGDDAQMPYWGEGAALGGLTTPPGFGTPPEPYRYHDRRIFAAITLRGGLFSAFGWHLRARWLDVDVATPSALLVASSPPGATGGKVGLGEIGLYFDTRDRELGTHEGVFATLAAFAAPQLGGFSDFAFHGYDASVRVYIPLWFGATLALRGLYDRKLAGVPRLTSSQPAVPFFERTLYEGVSYNEGLGGGSTVRGLARFRLAGDEKALGNAQLRVNLFSTHLFGKSQDFGIDGGIDAGAARQPGYPTVSGEGLAVGLRFVWDRAILLRVEMGRALQGGDQALYIAFGEMF